MSKEQMTMSKEQQTTMNSEPASYLCLLCNQHWINLPSPISECPECPGMPGRPVSDELGGVKLDEGKMPWHLLPLAATEQVIAVLQFGAEKYGDHNWLKGMAWSRLFSAACRHLFAFWRGDDLDQESGLPHLAHAACCVLFLLTYLCETIGEDDR